MKNVLCKCIASAPTNPQCVYIGISEDKRNTNINMVNCKSSPIYSNTTRKCAFCLHEKLEIIMYPEPDELLNKRYETISRCPHQRKYLLSNYDSKD